MESRGWCRARARCLAALVAVAVAVLPAAARADDLDMVKKRGVLRHLGVPYAKFFNGEGGGLDVELMKRFAAHLGVRYEQVATDWDRIAGDLEGKIIHVEGETVKVIGDAPVRGDVGANGITILPWRQRIMDFSEPTFPTQVWLIARADSPLSPIIPRGEVDADIAQVKDLLKGRSVLTKEHTCLDPRLYKLEDHGAHVHLFDGPLNDLVPALLNSDLDATILDVPDALEALERWHGKIKVIGPISQRQDMAAAFAKASPNLRRAFNDFLNGVKSDGSYHALVNRYYPRVFLYFPDFLAGQSPTVRTPAP